MHGKDASGDCTIVCLGGSAGGLQAFMRVLEGLPGDRGLAVVVISHFRRHVHRLHEVLPGHATMPVELIVDGMPIQPNRVYVAPTACDVQLLDGEFRLAPMSRRLGWPNVVTLFLRSLAQQWKGRMFSVIVSGVDSDGADALCEFRAAGGINIVQEPASAAHPDMPLNALATGCTDFVLPPAAIGPRIAELIALPVSRRSP